jgi:hypothetical protein
MVAAAKRVRSTGRAYQWRIHGFALTPAKGLIGSVLLFSTASGVDASKQELIAEKRRT